MQDFPKSYARAELDVCKEGADRSKDGAAMKKVHGYLVQTLLYLNTIA